VSFATLAYLIVCWRQVKIKRVVLLATVVPVVALLFNLFWIVPQYLALTETLSSIGARNSYQNIVDINLIWQEMLGYWAGHAQGSKVYTLLAFAAAWACWRERAPERVTLVRVFSLAAVFLVVFAAVGAAIPGASGLEPNRFAPVGYLMLCLPAAIGVGAMMTDAQAHGSIPQRAVAAIGLLGILLGAGYSLNEIRREITYGDLPHYGKSPPQVNGIGEYSRWILDWIVKETDDSGRVLYELSLGRVYDGSRMAGYYAYKSHREFIGGPYPFQHFASFWDGTLFRKRLADLPPAEFAKYVELYNLRWIIVHSDSSKRYLEGIPWVIPAGNFKQLRTYRIDQPSSYFLAGSGRIISRDHNRLVVSEIKGDSIILKYHFVPGLQSEPTASILPVYLLDDPKPFIKIINPPNELVLKIR
jgi:hypothetical protein